MKIILEKGTMKIILTNTNYKEVEGYYFKSVIKTGEIMDFFTHKLDNRGWTVSECKTGMKLIDYEKTRKNAINKALYLIENKLTLSKINDSLDYIKNRLSN